MLLQVKNYAENVGIVPQLEHAGFLRTCGFLLPLVGLALAHSSASRTGTTIARGFTTLPLAVVELNETEIAQDCALCARWESTGTQPRFKRCSGCKRRYYVRTSVSQLTFAHTDLDLTVLYRSKSASLD